MMRQTTDFWKRAGLAMVLAAGLAACGVKSQPVSPSDGAYPKQYPTALPPLAPGAVEKKEPQAPDIDPDSFYQYPNLSPEKAQ